MPVGEQMHIAGQEGVDLAKRWLEATGRFQVQWHVGEAGSVPYLSVDQVGRPKESFDLLATHLYDTGAKRVEVFAEIKNYNGVHDQADHYARFLTRCASAVLYWEDNPPVRPTEFMWVTWHPFGATDHYLRHVKAEAVNDACLKDFPKPGAPTERYRRVPENRVTEQMCNEVAKRLWFIIAPRRLEDMLVDQTN